MKSLFIWILCFIVITLLLPPSVFSHRRETYRLRLFWDINFSWRSQPDHLYLTVRSTQGAKAPQVATFFLEVANGVLDCLWFSITCAILLTISIANWVGSKSLTKKKKSLYNEKWKAGLTYFMQLSWKALQEKLNKVMIMYFFPLLNAFHF